MGLIIQYDHLRNYILFDFSSLTFLNSISIFCVFEYPSKFHIVLKGLLFLRVFLRVWGHLWGMDFLHFFLCDIQMLLPEGIHRENNKMYEEVEIPPNEPMPLGFEEKPVYISELDEVGAIVCCVCTLCVDTHVWLHTGVRLKFCFEGWWWHFWSHVGLLRTIDLFSLTLLTDYL